MIIGYLEHEMGTKPRMRIHHPSNAGDQFDIIEWNEFEQFKTIGEKVGITFVDLDLHPDYEGYKI